MIKVNIEQQIGPSDCVALSNVFTNIERKDFKEIIQADEIAFIMKPIEGNKKSINKFRNSTSQMCYRICKR